MTTTQQLAAAHAFLASCEPANALRVRPATQKRQDWQHDLRAAQQARAAARTTVLELCGTRAGYQEAIAAAKESRRLG